MMSKIVTAVLAACILCASHQGVAGESMHGPTELEIRAVEKIGDGSVTPRSERAVQTIRMRYKTAESVTLIVGLNAPVLRDAGGESSNEVATDEDDRTIRQQVRAVSDSFLARYGYALKSRRYEDFYAYENFPYVRVKATSKVFEALLLDKNVTTIEEDSYGTSTLLQSIPQVGADTAHAAGKVGSGYAIAILDNGIFYDHPALSGKVVSEGCYGTKSAQLADDVCAAGFDSPTSAAGSGWPSSIAFNHGTMVAGAALGNSSSGYGVAKGANLIAMNVLSYTDTGPLGGIHRQGDLVAALDRVYTIRTTYNVAAVNMSIVLSATTAGASMPLHAGACDSSFPSLAAAINQLTTAKVAVVAGAPNGGGLADSDKMWAPACIGNAIAVSAVLKTNADAGYGNVSSATDLLAPGGDLSGNCATVPTKLRLPHATNTLAAPVYGWTCSTGTSFATPHVAGALTLLKAESPTATVAALLDQLVTTGSPLTVSRNGSNFTVPRLDVEAALASPSSPSSLTIGRLACYGNNSAGWPVVSGPVTKYELQGSTSSTFSSTMLYYSGATNHALIDVPSTTYLRVRACNGIICSTWRNGNQTATYVPNCL